jgi:arylformamidase
MTASAQKAPARIKGPIVWLDMDQQELDDAYDQHVYARNQPQIAARRNAANARAKPFLGEPQRVAYGPSEIEKLDIYRAPQPSGPVCIFVHGGAWRQGKSADFALQAEPVIKAGGNYVILDFTNVDAAGGDLFPMVEQVRRAVAWVYRNAASFGSDPQRLYLSSHSSGSHLSGCVVTHDWQAEGLPRDILKGALLSSGMYDLRPVRLSKRSAYVNFTDDMVQKLSAIRHLDKLHTPLIVSHGSEETPEFQRQAKEFAAAVAAAGKPVQLIVGEGYNHFELPETLANPYGYLGRALLQMMKLA